MDLLLSVGEVGLTTATAETCAGGTRVGTGVRRRKGSNSVYRPSGTEIDLVAVIGRALMEKGRAAENGCIRTEAMSAVKQRPQSVAWHCANTT